jgi:hypothetical protein
VCGEAISYTMREIATSPFGLLAMTMHNYFKI